ncbi:MAG: gamma carbonic anhydrase family protein [Arthrobacter sp.]|uniref:gamma carbonic anhydrase family protein n=1 Tax=Arthrobacter sp. TaxID=1667 RepID=UPI00346C37D6
MAGHVLGIDGREPRIPAGAWVAPTATVVGDVTLGAGVGIFYGAVLRADREAIEIGRGTNVQDTAVVHADPGHPARIGDDVSVGHGAVLHGCTVGDGALIGMNATVLNAAVVGAGSLVAANALVLEGTVVPPGSLVAGVPAKVRRPLTEAETAHCLANAETYRTLTVLHAEANGGATLASVPTRPDRELP